jgi:hypothetical protein
MKKMNSKRFQSKLSGVSILRMSATQTLAGIPSSHGTIKLNNAHTFSNTLRSMSLWDRYEQSEFTPLIGTAIKNVSLADILRAPDCDARVRDLAILISSRGFCVFHKQTDLTIADQKLLCRKLGQLTTRPSTSDLWIHPVNQTRLPDGTLDGEVMSPSRDPTKKLCTKVSAYFFKRGQTWHLPHWHHSFATVNGHRCLSQGSLVCIRSYVNTCLFLEIRKVVIAQPLRRIRAARMVGTRMDPSSPFLPITLCCT